MSERFLSSDEYDEQAHQLYNEGRYDDALLESATTTHNERRKVGRNDPCPCGSGKKYKKCCLNKSRVNPLLN